MDRKFRPVYSKDFEDARSQSDDEDSNKETDEVNPAEDHQWPWLVPGLPAIDIDAPVPRFPAPCLLPDNHDCPEEETWQWSVSIYESTVQYHRNDDNPVYPTPTETFPNPDPLDLYPDVQISLEPRSLSPVPGPSRQRDAPQPAFKTSESLNSQQDITPGYFMLENSSTSTATSPVPSTSRQSEERELPAKPRQKPRQYDKNTTRFLTKWQRREDNADTSFRSAFKPYARPPKVTITPPSPPLPCQTADAIEVVPTKALPSVALEVEVEITRDTTSSPEQTDERSVDSPISPLLILSLVCSKELLLLEEGSDSDEKT